MYILSTGCQWRAIPKRGNPNKQFGVRSDFPEWPSMIRGGADPDGRLAPTPQGEWARRLGALPPKRMVASWSGSSTDPTGYKDAAQVLPAEPVSEETRTSSSASARISPNGRR